MNCLEIKFNKLRKVSKIWNLYNKLCNFQTFRMKYETFIQTSRVLEKKNLKTLIGYCSRGSSWGWNFFVKDSLKIVYLQSILMTSSNIFYAQVHTFSISRHCNDFQILQIYSLNWASKCFELENYYIFIYIYNLLFPLQLFACWSKDNELQNEHSSKSFTFV